VLIAKSRDVLIDRLTARVKELHSYTVPCVVALPIVQGNADYLRWIRDETSGQGKLSEN
ncbi:MAG: divalent cation tolerance protein CutA, partial [Alphaproteobacteria bacterium]